jgi:hypothetical protein
VEYINQLGSLITSHAKCAHETKFRTVVAEMAFNKRKILFTRKLDLNL